MTLTVRVVLAAALVGCTAAPSAAPEADDGGTEEPSVACESVTSKAECNRRSGCAWTTLDGGQSCVDSEDEPTEVGSGDPSGGGRGAVAREQSDDGGMSCSTTRNGSEATTIGAILLAALVSTRRRRRR